VGEVLVVAPSRQVLVVGVLPKVAIVVLVEKVEPIPKSRLKMIMMMMSMMIMMMMKLRSLSLSRALQSMWQCQVVVVSLVMRRNRSNHPPSDTEKLQMPVRVGEVGLFGIIINTFILSTAFSPSCVDDVPP